MTDEKYLPCPFCGSNARLDRITDDEKPRFVIACINTRCGAMAWPHAWNQRVLVEGRHP